MTAIARLKPVQLDPDLNRLGALVLAVQARFDEPGVKTGWDASQALWPEAIALAQSIENDGGWQLFVQNRGEMYEKLFLYLDAPQVFVRYLTSGTLDITPRAHPWSWEFHNKILRKATWARYKRLGREVPPYTEAVLTDMRERKWFQWGRP